MCPRLRHEVFWYWKVGAQGTVLASNFDCSTDAVISGFHNVESESDDRQVGGTGNDTCVDQKSGRMQGTIFHPLPSHEPQPPPLDTFLSDLRATLRGRFDILVLDAWRLTFRTRGFLPHCLDDRQSS